MVWMVDQSSNVGLDIQPSPIRIEADREALRTTGQVRLVARIHQLLELLPILRLTYEDSTKTTRYVVSSYCGAILISLSLPHIYQGRVITKGQEIHASVRVMENYMPKAKFHRDMHNIYWDDILGPRRDTGSSRREGINIFVDEDSFRIPEYGQKPYVKPEDRKQGILSGYSGFPRKFFVLFACILINGPGR